MAHPRKRLYAVRRGPDGSAFQKCQSCGLSVAIALADMHDCEIKKNVRKKLKSHCGDENIRGQRIQDQPRSAFHFFMEEFVKTCNGGNEVEINKKGFEKWKNMMSEERQPFVLQANKLNLAYVKLLLKEESEKKWVLVLERRIRLAFCRLMMKRIQLRLANTMRTTRMMKYFTTLTPLKDQDSSYLRHTGALILKICFWHALGLVTMTIEDLLSHSSVP